MDPNELYLAMAQAMEAAEYGQAREYALALKEHLDGSGTWPDGIDKFAVRAYLNLVLFRTTSTELEKTVVLPFRLDWLVYIKDIDVKGCDWPWCDERWNDISKYIIKTWWDNGTLKGFSVFQFDTEGFISISKLVIHPMHRGQWRGETLLFNDIEETAKRHGVSELRITIWEHDDNQIKGLTALGFRAIGLHGKFPDGSDGYEFAKKMINGEDNNGR